MLEIFLTSWLWPVLSFPIEGDGDQEEHDEGIVPGPRCAVLADDTRQHQAHDEVEL